MNNIPTAALRLLPNTDAHFVLFASDLYQLLSNTNGALSIYAWLYDKFKDYKETAKLALYKTMVAKFVQSNTLDGEKKDQLDKIIEWEYDYFHGIMSSKREKKFDELQYSFVTALYDALGKRDSIPHTTSSYRDNSYTSTQTRLLPSYKVIGHGGPHS